MVFAPVFQDGSLATHKTKAAHIKKRKAADDCLDVVANVFNIQTKERTLKHPLRFVGVAIDGIVNGRDAKNHPDSCGRFAVQVYGDCSIIVNKEDIKSATIGDKVECFTHFPF